MIDTPADRPCALVVYESMFGCTEAVTRAIVEGLEDGGLDTVVEEARHAGLPRDRHFDLLVVGAPTHAFSLSRPSTRQDAVRQGARPELAEAGLREWIMDIGPEDGQERPAVAFDTRVTRVRHLPKAASTRASHLLTRRGFRVIERPAPFFVQDLKGPLVEGERERARAWGRRVALRYLHENGAPGAAAG
ncbi:MAG TPA: hypothetical protein VFT70_06345 [Nocardioides sp.]|nr:hypothetical protein [Nocardioides sp.]